MKKQFIACYALMLAASAAVLAEPIKSEKVEEVKMNRTLYDFTVTNNQDEAVSMSVYKDKVLLLVNTASKCGFTPQYKGLEALYLKYKERGLVVIGFPCNQFGKQEPGTAEEIASFCELNYGVTFPLMAKINVNGKDADPLYVFLKEQAPGSVTNAIKWNFTKFLVSRDGTSIKRFASADKPIDLEKDIEALLAK